MRRYMTVCAAATLLICGLGSAQTAPPPKKRVAVFNFEYATVANNIAAIFGSNQDVGKGIADLIVDRLVGSAVYSVYERKAIEKIMAEQNFSNSDRADPSAAAKIGRLLGVDAIIIGSITQFGRDDRQRDVGGGALSRVTGRYGIGGVGTKQSKAVVGLSARIVSVDTGEVVAIASGKGESTRSGAGLLGSGGGAVAGTGTYDMQSRNFADTILGEAVTQAVNALAAQIDSQNSRIAARKIVLDGLIADVSGQTMIINLGSRAGVKVGDKLEVLRRNKPITDPATGKVLRYREETLGELVITQVDEVSAEGRFSGAGAPKVGDAVKGKP